MTVGAVLLRVVCVLAVLSLAGCTDSKGVDSVAPVLPPEPMGERLNVTVDFVGNLGTDACVSIAPNECYIRANFVGGNQTWIYHGLGARILQADVEVSWEANPPGAQELRFSIGMQIPRAGEGTFSNVESDRLALVTGASPLRIQQVFPMDTPTEPDDLMWSYADSHGGVYAHVELMHPTGPVDVEFSVMQTFQIQGTMELWIPADVEEVHRVPCTRSDC